MPKTLKTKKIFVWAIYQNLRSIPPKDYPSTGEIKSTITEVLPALKAVVSEYVEFFKRGEDLNEKMVAKQMTDEEAKVAVETINNDMRAFNKDHGNDVVDIVLEGEGFTTLKTQFNRDEWGTKWLSNIEEYGELVESFAQAEK